MSCLHSLVGRHNSYVGSVAIDFKQKSVALALPTATRTRGGNAAFPGEDPQWRAHQLAYVTVSA